MPTFEPPIDVLLGGLFLLAAAGKLLRLPDFRRALAGYRLARPVVVVAVAVPAAELAIGLALVSGLRTAGWAALVLLAAFSAALAVELADGNRPPACGCLPGAGTPGPWALTRNGALAVAAVAVGLGLHPVLGEAFWVASYAALWLAVAALAALVLALYRQVGVLHLRLGPRGALEHEAEGLPLGEPAPHGLAGKLVVFTSESCPICHQIVPGLRALASDHALEVVHAHHEDVHGRELEQQFLVPGTPFAVYVDVHGDVRAKGTVNTLEQLEGLIVTGRRRERELQVVHAA